MKVGLLTSGGDCQGLNACLRGVSKTLYNMVPGIEIYGVENGFYGLLLNEWRRMAQYEFSGILRQGGTILGTSRTPKTLPGFEGRELSYDEQSDIMAANYEKAGFDALIILGGDGTHKGATLLAERGVNIVTMPKTIDNDLWGTDVTFGFDSAVEKATFVIDAIHTTAAAHGRVFIIELMGRDVGWIALHAGVAGGADVILLPEIPYKLEKVLEVVDARNRAGKFFTIIAMAEGAVTEEEARLSKAYIKKLPPTSMRLEVDLTANLEQDVRVAIPGHYQRGGDPTPTDRILCSRMGAKAAEMVMNGEFGRMVALHGNSIGSVPLGEVAGKTKSVPLDHEVVHQARLLGVSFGD